MIYKKINCNEELPETQGFYDTSLGELYYSKEGLFTSTEFSSKPYYPTNWYKPIEEPEIDMIKKRITLLHEKHGYFQGDNWKVLVDAFNITEEPEAKGVDYEGILNLFQPIKELIEDGDERHNGVYYHGLITSLMQEAAKQSRKEIVFPDEQIDSESYSFVEGWNACRDKMREINS